MENLFEELNKIDVSAKTEKKGGLTYLSWAWAWSSFKAKCPDATYKIKKFNGLPYVYDEKTGYMVFTSVTVGDLTHEMWLPVMDFRNKAMKDTATMFDINKTMMRCLTKNLAMFGLGLYIYAGEDLPAQDEEKIEEVKEFQIKRNEIGTRIKILSPELDTSKYREFIKEKTGETYNEKTNEEVINKILDKLEALVSEKQLV